MRKFFKSISLFVIALAPSLGAIPVSAATPTHISVGGIVSIVREVNGVSNPVTNDFSYTLTADESNPAAIGGLEDVAISMNQVSPDTDGIARAELLLNLSNLTFTQVGDYVIHVRETASADSANYPVDETNEYQLLVSVRNVMQNNVPTGELTASLADQPINVDGDKVEKMKFANYADRVYLALAKHISGNNANTDEYFKFRIDFENATVGDVFTISGQDATVTYKGETIATQTRFVVGEENYIYLKGGQEALIGRDDDYNNEEIPIGLRYTITELDAEDYNTYVDDSKTESKVSTEKITTSYNDSQDLRNGLDPYLQNMTDFENAKNTAVATGISSIVLPFAGLLVIGVVSTCVYLAISKKKQD